MNYKYILFDLDGTITDSKEGIVASVQFALDKMGVPETKVSNLEKFVGPPLKFSFQEYYAFSDEFAEKAIEYYREYYREKGIYENKLYDGIIPLLQSLKQSGFTIALATSKPTIFATKILEHFNVAQYFDIIVGSNLDGTRTDKAEVISYVCEHLPIYNVNQAVMIGDRMYDINGANAMEMDSIGVLYSDGSLEEFQEANATYVVNSVEELGALLDDLEE